MGGGVFQIRWMGGRVVSKFEGWGGGWVPNLKDGGEGVFQI